MSNINFEDNKAEVIENGFSIIPGVFSENELKAIPQLIDQTDLSSPSFRKTSDLFAVRRFLKEIPAAKKCCFN